MHLFKYLTENNWNNFFCLCKNTLTNISLTELFNIYVALSGIIISVDLTFNPMIGVLGESTLATCIASVTVNVSLCSVQFDYGLVTNEVAGGAGLDLYNTLTISPVTISSAGEYTCTVSIVDTLDCTRNISPKTSEAVTLKVQCALQYLFLLFVVCLLVYQTFE